MQEMDATLALRTDSHTYARRSRHLEPLQHHYAQRCPQPFATVAIIALSSNTYPCEALFKSIQCPAIKDRMLCTVASHHHEI
jgi:hypothetical protein